MPLNPNTITGKIYLKIFELLEANPKGIQWTQLNKMIEEAYPDFQPKTINGCVWKLTQLYPEKVEKPEKGLIRIIR